MNVNSDFICNVLSVTGERLTEATMTTAAHVRAFAAQYGETELPRFRVDGNFVWIGEYLLYVKESQKVNGKVSGEPAHCARQIFHDAPTAMRESPERVLTGPLLS